MAIRVLVSRKTSRLTPSQAKLTSHPAMPMGIRRRLKALDAASQSEWRVLTRESSECCGKQHGGVRGRWWMYLDGVCQIGEGSTG